MSFNKVFYEARGDLPWAAVETNYRSKIILPIPTRQKNTALLK